MFFCTHLLLCVWADQDRWLGNILGKMKEFAELNNPINYFIHKMIHHSAWYCWNTTTKTTKNKSFPWRKLASSTDHLHKSFSLDTCDKTTFQITSSCWTVYWRKAVLYFTHHRQQYNLKHTYTSHYYLISMRQVAHKSDYIIIHAGKNDITRDINSLHLVKKIVKKSFPITKLALSSILLIIIISLTCWFHLDWVERLPYLFWVSLFIQFCSRDLSLLASYFCDYLLLYFSIPSWVYLVHGVHQLLVLLCC